MWKCFVFFYYKADELYFLKNFILVMWFVWFIFGSFREVTFIVQYSILDLFLAFVRHISSSFPWCLCGFSLSSFSFMFYLTFWHLFPRCFMRLFSWCFMWLFGTFYRVSSDDLCLSSSAAARQQQSTYKQYRFPQSPVSLFAILKITNI